MDGISLESIGVILALVIAMCGVALIPVVYFFERTRKEIEQSAEQLRTTVEELRKQNEIIFEMVDTTADLCEAMDSKSIFMGGLVERSLALAGEDSTVLGRLTNEMTKYNEAKNKSLSELLLFSRRRNACLSALQVLSEKLGTVSSLRRMQLAVRRDRIDPSLLERYLEALERRLDRIR